MPNQTASRARVDNRITVTVATLSQDVKTIRLRQGATVEEALLKAGYRKESLKEVISGLRVNNRRVNLNTELPAGAFMTVAPNVEGGRI